MKVLAAAFMTVVFAISLTASAAKKTKSSATTAPTKCSKADKKSGKCAPGEAKTTVSANSVRKASMESASSRAPASAQEQNWH